MLVSTLTVTETFLITYLPTLSYDLHEDVQANRPLAFIMGQMAIQCITQER